MFYFVCSDPDLKKDSVTQTEVILRGLSDVVDQHHGLPLGFVCQQDNCPREGKNTFILSTLALLVVLDVFRYTMAEYLRKGHSHEDIDGSFGQISGYIARQEFGTIMELVDILDAATKPDSRADSLRSSSLRGTAVRRHSCAYKLDETADWKSWQKHLGLRFKGIHGAGSMKFCRRGDVDPASLGTTGIVELTNNVPSAGDILVIAKAHPADNFPYKARLFVK